jgi:hypothetical protein
MDARGGQIYTPHERHTRLGRIDPTTGAGTDVGSFEQSEPGYRLASGAFDVQGDFYSIALLPGNVGSQLLRVDLSTGASTTIGPRGDIPLLGMEVDANDTMYAVRLVVPAIGLEGDPELFTVDKTNGALTAIGNTGVEHTMDLAFDPQGTLWAVGGGQGGGNRLYTIDPATGASAFRTNISDVTGDIDVTPGGVEIMGIMFNENGTMFGTAFLPGPEPNPYESPLFTIDTETGLATEIGDTGFRLPHGGDYLVPEPSSLIMVLLGGLLLVAAGSRRLRARS